MIVLQLSLKLFPIDEFRQKWREAEQEEARLAAQEVEWAAVVASAGDQVLADVGEDGDYIYTHILGNDELQAEKNRVCARLPS